MYFMELYRDLEARLVTADTTGFYKLNDKILWLQRALDEIANFTYQDPESGKMRKIDWDWLKASHTDTTVADQESYDLPSDMRFGGLRFVKVSNSEGDKVEFVIVTLEEYEREEGEWYGICTIKDDKLYIKFNNDGSGLYKAYDLSGDTITMEYIKKPTTPTLTSRGTITAFAYLAATTTTVTSGTHNLANGDYVTIVGTPNYDGTYVVSGVAANTFVITAQYIADDACGTWYESSVLEPPDEFSVVAVQLALATCLSKEKQFGEAQKEKEEARNYLIGLTESMLKQKNSVFLGRARSSRWD